MIPTRRSSRLCVLSAMASSSRANKSLNRKLVESRVTEVEELSSDSSSASRHSQAPVEKYQEEDVEDVPEFAEEIPGDFPEGAESVKIFPDPEFRYAQRRTEQKDLDSLYPKLAKLSKKPYNLSFVNARAYDRYKLLQQRKFLDAKLFPLDDPKLASVGKILDKAGLMYTVLDVQPYVEEIVREFYANVVDLVLVGGIYKIFIRGKLFECSPDTINKLFDISVPSDLLGTGISSSGDLDAAVQLVTGGLISRFEDMRSSALTPDMYALHHLCCFNWMPSTNRTTICKERLLLLKLIVEAGPLDFGHLVFEHILSVANSPEKVNNVLPFPNLIYQLLVFQRKLGSVIQTSDTWSAQPQLFCLDSKVAKNRKGRGSDKAGSSGFLGSSSKASKGPPVQAQATSTVPVQPPPNLEMDLKQLRRLFSQVQSRLANGEYACFCKKSQDHSAIMDEDLRDED